MLGDGGLGGRLPPGHLELLLDGIQLSQELLEEAGCLPLQASLD